MPIPTFRRLLAIVILAGGLFSGPPLGVAEDATVRPDAIGLTGTVSLRDEQLSTLRGGSLASFLQSFLSNLPPGNTLSATIGRLPTFTQTGPGTQSLSCGAGLTCQPGTSITLFSSVTVTRISGSH